MIRYAKHFVDTPNHKFDKMILIMEETLDTIKEQAPTAEAYDKLKKQLNMSFQWVFEKLDDL